MNMKKILFAILPAVALLFASCDPIHEENGPGANMAVETLQNSVTLSQATAMSNDFTFTTSPATYIQIYDAKGNQLARGTAGSFNYVPTRGSDTHQILTVKAINPDGSVIECQKEVDVEVAGELAPEMKLLVSDSGSKVWKWNPVVYWNNNGVEHYGSWGNAGYYADNGNNYGGANVPGAWFACEPENLIGQLQHSDTGVATGEEDPNAYMVWDEDGNIKTYDANGQLIRSGKFTVDGYTGERIPNADGTPWNLGTLHVEGGAILFPFKINGGGMKPTDFEIMQLTPDNLILIYADAGTGGWAECTWWNFKSESDGEGCLTGSGEKVWTWNPVVYWNDNGVEHYGSWGNAGYYADNGNNYGGANVPGAWFACEPENLIGQLQHSNTGKATGEEDPNAYMVFNGETKTIKSYDANGKEIRSGSFELIWNNGERTPNSDGTPWKAGTLKTSEGAILFPFKINGGGYMPTQFEVMSLTNDNLILIYADEGTGGWSECTWWNFKAKK